jgi:glycosyltransferase involved in cell wall biosynthesis
MEEGSSAGHGRLRAAVDAGVPVVASRVRALEGYVEDGETALLVPPGDPEALRSAIEAVLADHELATRLREGAVAHAGRWTYGDYFDAVRGLLMPGGKAGHGR